MRKRKRARFFPGGAAILAVVLSLCIPSGLLLWQWPAFSEDDPDGAETSQPDSTDTPAVTRLATDLALDCELVEIAVNGDTLKIDAITPGLDTYSATVILYDLQAGTVLSQTLLSEAAWETGLTDNGFYAVDTAAKTLYLYDRTGHVKWQKTFDIAGNWSPVCAVSPDETHFVFTDAHTGTIDVYAIQTDEYRSFPASAAYRECVGFFDGKLYVVSVDRELAYIDPAQMEEALVLVDSRLSLMTPTYCIGTGEFSFIVSDTEKTVYIPFERVDELVVGSGPAGFTTAVSHETGDSLRSYDIRRQQVLQTELPAPVQSACYTESGDLVAVTGAVDGRQHSLFFCDLSKATVRELTVNDTDKPVSGTYPPLAEEADPSPSAAMVANVPVLSQFPDYPTGCESVSTVMALQFAGESVTTAAFIDGYLPMSMDFYYADGRKYGPSPYTYFIGNPRTAASYGCMAPVIEQALTAYFGNTDRFANVSGTSLEELCHRYIDQGTPVILWATIGMLETNPQNTWYLPDGNRYSWPGNEHCMLLIGYDETAYYFNDPYAGRTVRYEKQLTADRYAELGMQALVIYAAR